MIEEPGTYFWHGHSGTEKVDSFFGPLIVRPRGPEPVRYNEERVLLLTDNYHEEAAPLTFGLNRYELPIARSRFIMHTAGCALLHAAILPEEW